MRYIKAFISLVVCAFLLACTPHYDYTPKSPAEIPATVRGGVDAGFRYGFEIHTINGTSIGHDWVGTRESRESKFQIPPGPTTITGVVGATRMVSQFASVEFKFIAEPGHDYYPYLSLNGHQLILLIKDSDKVLAMKTFTVSTSYSVIPIVGKH